MATPRTPTRRSAAPSRGAGRTGEPAPARREPPRRDPAQRDPKPAAPAKKDPPAREAAPVSVRAKAKPRGERGANEPSASKRSDKPRNEPSVPKPGGRRANAASAPKRSERRAKEPLASKRSDKPNSDPSVPKPGDPRAKPASAPKRSDRHANDPSAFIDPAAGPARAVDAGQSRAPRATGNAKAATSKTARAAATPLPENIALVLQGGGALGAYQAGVYQGLFEAGIAPNWIAGISIGAFNTAIIAGNPPEKRMDALRDFWATISQPNLLPATTFGQEARFADLDPDTRGWLDTWEAWRAIVEGQRGFYQPRAWLGQDPFSPPGPAQASWYDTAPMIATLERMVDFDRLNDGGIRVSVGAVNVRTGNLEYFDNTRMRLDARHILASGALPPAFPAIEIDGEFYWDGGLVSNTPLSHVLAASPRRDTLVFQVDLWNARGDLPCNLLDVAERQKEIQYSSRTRLITDTQRVFQHYRRLLRELLEEIPADVRTTNPWAQYAAELACDRRYSVVHLIYRDRARIGHFKDYQFGAVAMREHWLSGQGDIARALAHPEWLELPQGESAFVTHDATAP